MNNFIKLVIKSTIAVILSLVITFASSIIIVAGLYFILNIIYPCAISLAFPFPNCLFYADSIVDEFLVVIGIILFIIFYALLSKKLSMITK